MKMKRMTRILSLLMALMMCAALATGCTGTPAEGGGGDVQTTAMSEEEYMAAVAQMMTDYTNAMSDVGSIDPTDIEGAKQVLTDSKKPFEKISELNPPESCQELHDKLSAGCKAYNEFIDLSIETMDETDAAKIQENSARLMELQTEVQTNFTDVASLMTNIG